MMQASITHAFVTRQLACLITMVALTFGPAAIASSAPGDAEITQFKTAWEAAGRGDRATFNQFKDQLSGYLLFPYLQYEDYRNRRDKVPVDEMSDFLQAHDDWAFSSGLRAAWLKSLAKNKRWADLVAHSEGVRDTVLRCQRVRGQIILKQTDGILKEAQQLWAVGKSQPDECDPVFAWLVNRGG